MDVGMETEISFFIYTLSFLNFRCGSGNRGQTIMDGIDACCKTHDACYRGWGYSASYYLITNFDCESMINRTPARYQACICDKTAAQCFARNKYNPKMKGRCNK